MDPDNAIVIDEDLEEKPISLTPKDEDLQETLIRPIQSNLSQVHPRSPASSERTSTAKQAKTLNITSPTSEVNQPHQASSLSASLSRQIGPTRQGDISTSLPRQVNQPRQVAIPNFVLARPQPPTLRFVPATWPHRIVPLRSNFNPDAITLPFIEHFGSCECATPCRHSTCRNATLGIFCAENCCPFKGHCGNGLIQRTGVTLVKNALTQSFAVMATKPIAKGVIVGEYLGRLTLEPPRSSRVRNTGYRLVVQQSIKQGGQYRPCIDAETFGSLMRFANHSCNPSAAFYKLSNGSVHTVVVATTRKIKAGDEVTVDYGSDLWFICRCGLDVCRHADIQHLHDP